MFIKTKKESIFMAAPAAVLFCSFVFGSADSLTVKSGWIKGGNAGYAYEIGKDKEVRHGNSASCYIRSKGWPEGYGMIVNQIKAKRFVGKRVRMSAYIQTESVTEWVGMMMRVDGRDPNDRLGFDNMHERPIQGTTGWQRYEIVLDVPKSAKKIVFGLLLTGPGKAWLDDVRFDAVGGYAPEAEN